MLMDQISPNTLGKLMITAGGIIVLAGLILVFADKLPFIWKIPGDIYLKGKSFSFFLPIVTCLILSIVLTVIINLILRK